MSVWLKLSKIRTLTPAQLNFSECFLDVPDFVGVAMVRSWCFVSYILLYNVCITTN